MKFWAHGANAAEGPRRKKLVAHAARRHGTSTAPAQRGQASKSGVALPKKGKKKAPAPLDAEAGGEVAVERTVPVPLWNGQYPPLRGFVRVLLEGAAQQLAANQIGCTVHTTLHKAHLEVVSHSVIEG
ncbi:MAG: hypothetical protein MUD01_21135 [Chloroflexaceae bacterium]|nr:hypothetical protein [Chloroflexaceae bacterium]